MDRRPYVYELTDVQTKMVYIGARYAKGCKPEDIGVTYFTSSCIVRPLFEADPSRFKVKILLVGHPDYVREAESNLLRLLDAMRSTNYYNLKNGAPSIDDCRASGLWAVKSGQLAAFRTREHQRIAGRAGGLKSASRLKFYASEGGKLGGRKNVETGHIKRLGETFGRVNGLYAMTLRYKCAECGMETVPAALGRHQRYSGHKGVLK